MEVKAQLRHLRISPRKVRLVAGLIRGMDVATAVAQLRFMQKAAARPVLKLLESAVANAEHNFKLAESNLFVKQITVDGGPVLKRWRARAFGRAASIRKHSSNILIVLDERVGEAKGVAAAVVAKSTSGGSSEGRKASIKKLAAKKPAAKAKIKK